MDACGWGTPTRYSKPFLLADSRAASSKQDVSLDCKRQCCRSQQRQGSAARVADKPCKGREHAGRSGRAASSVSADAAASALRQQCETTRLLARLLAGLTLQWREVMVDLTKAHVPFSISDAAAAAASRLGERRHIERCHDHRCRSTSPSQPRSSCRPSSAVENVESKSYLTKARRFRAQAHEVAPTRLRDSDQRRTPSASRRNLCAGHSFHCTSDALRTDAKVYSTATSWHCLTPSVQWIPYVLHENSAECHDTHTRARGGLCESSVLHTSSPSPSRFSSAKVERDAKGGGGVYIGRGVRTDSQLRRTVLEEAARSAEVIILGMRQVREVLTPKAVATVSRNDPDGRSRHRSRRGSPCKSTWADPSSTPSDSLSSATSAEANQISAYHHHHKSNETHTQQYSDKTPLDEARRSSTRCRGHALGHNEGVEPPSIFFSSAATPSRSQCLSQSAGDSPFATAATSAASTRVLVYPAPPASDRVYIYPRADRSATVVSPLRHRTYSATSAGALVADPSSHWNHGLEWQAPGAAAPVSVRAWAKPAVEPAASMDTYGPVSDPHRAPASLAQVMELPAASPATRSGLSPSTLSSSVAASLAQSTSQARWTALTYEESEARLLIVMAHSCHFVGILRDYYECLRELEWESQRHSLTTTIGTVSGEQEAATVWAHAPITATRTHTRKSDTNHVADPVNSPPSAPSWSRPSTSIVSAHTETISEVAMSQAAQMPPTRDGEYGYEGEGTPNEVQLSASTTATATGISNTYDVSSPPLQGWQPVSDMNSATYSRARDTRDSATTPHASRLPARRLPTSHLMPILLRDNSTFAAVTAADAPTAPASVSVSAPRTSAKELAPLSPPPVQPSALLQQLRDAATVEKNEETYVELTPTMTRHARSRTTGGNSRLFLSPLEVCAEKVTEGNPSSDSDSRATAASTSRSSSITYIVEENVEQTFPSSTTNIVDGLGATAVDRASLTAASRGPPPPPQVGANGTHRGNLDDGPRPSPRTHSEVPPRLIMAVELFPVGDTDTSAAGAPLPRKRQIVSPSPLPSVQDMDNVGNANTATVNGIEVASVTNEAYAASFSSVSSFDEKAIESPVTIGDAEAAGDTSTTTFTATGCFPEDPVVECSSPLADPAPHM
ncbi:hypothetical protein, unknown function [Leishmania tarentolae]|uniref:Uncharacterized protein n=1 Tax=Leishmania tarentolae TaxID=5689 RepID=A0A640KD19_LEITA|nr:hypothetical protein, unknown function [Leishmania tarentolae]